MYAIKVDEDTVEMKYKGMEACCNHMLNLRVRDPRESCNHPIKNASHLQRSFIIIIFLVTRE